MQDNKSDGTFVGIQTLRFFAALLVVLAHATQMLTARMGIGSGPWENGTAGVDVFFVISGFVMALSAAPLVGRVGGWRDFLTRRIIRVVPMYWIATTLKIGMVLAVPAMALHTTLSPDHIVASYLFFPWPNREGSVFPVLTVGWTLNFEMFFYAVVSLALLVRKLPLIFCAIVFASTAGCGLVLDTLMPDRSGLSEYMLAIHALLNPIVVEFIFGMIIATFIRRAVIPTYMAVLLLLVAVAALLLGDAHNNWRPLTWGVPAAVIVAAIVQLEPSLRSWTPKWLLQQGDSSYALYLFHPFVVPFVGVLLLKMGLPYPLLAILACLVISSVTCP